MKKRAILAALWAGLVCVSLCSCRGAEDADERGSLVSEAERVETEEIPQDEEDPQTPEPGARIWRCTPTAALRESFMVAIWEAQVKIILTEPYLSAGFRDGSGN